MQKQIKQIKQIKQLKHHLIICKLIILALLAFIILQALPSDILTDDISPTSNDYFRIEEAKAHDLEVYKKSIGE